MDDSHESNQFGPDAPLRLSIAAKLAFPDGSMTASGLRREAARGRLQIERIANKDFVTLAEIKRMRELCRVLPSDQSTQIPLSGPSASSEPAAAISPQDALRARLKQNRLQAHGKS
jgi:hypothetical protein